MLDLNTKKIKKNAFRITKIRNKTSIRVRIPGGQLPAEIMPTLYKIATEYGDGKLHMTARQGFEITGIGFEHMDTINEIIAPIIEKLQVAQGVQIEDPKKGYPASGTRNISACIGNRICPYANYNTTEFARRLEEAVFPHDHHFKLATTGCPNDCAKAHLQDFGVIGMARVQYNQDLCVGCEACVKNCKKRVVNALELVDGKVVRNEDKCVECGECVLTCPMLAWTRKEEKLYKLVIMGRTGKVSPRLARPFIEGVDEESIIKIIKNTYDYVDEYIDRSLPKEHVGYIVDRTGYQVFKEWALKGVNLPKEAKVAEHIYW